LLPDWRSPTVPPRFQAVGCSKLRVIGPVAAKPAALDSARSFARLRVREFGARRRGQIANRRSQRHHGSWGVSVDDRGKRHTHIVFKRHLPNRSGTARMAAFLCERGRKCVKKSVFGQALVECGPVGAPTLNTKVVAFAIVHCCEIREARESAAGSAALYACKYHGLRIRDQRPNESIERE